MVFNNNKNQSVLDSAYNEATQIKKEAERQAANIKEEAKEYENELQKKLDSIKNKEKELDNLIQNLTEKLKKTTGISKDQAKEMVLESWNNKLKEEVAKTIKQNEEEIKSRSEETAKKILIDAMRYGAIDYVAEYTLSTVVIPSEDFKGRIIGKDGRNIRAFELATGVDVDLEEEGVIKLSSFNAVKREIARISLEKLIRDGRIQPGRIEEIVKKTKEEIEKIMFKEGEDLAHKVGVYNLPSEVTKTLGNFKYRYSYGQNMILHTLEETKIGVALAYELKANVNTVKLGCLFHDIGKVITDKEGSHVELGVEFLKKYGFPKEVIDCVASHHEDIPFPTIEAVIVYIADAVSGGRPGARHEDFEEYLKRIKSIEDIAKSKKGVLEAHALQAGRELRVIVKPEDISDDESVILAQTIKEELEKKFEVFPGQIKITVLREFRTETTTKI
jgi:ribonuclease Y